MFTLETGNTHSSLWTVNNYTKRGSSSILPWGPPPLPATYCFTPPQVRPGEGGKFLPDHYYHTWHWVLWAWLSVKGLFSLSAASVAFSRTLYWNFPSGSPRIRAVPLLLAATICHQLLISIRILFWSPLTLRLNEALLGKTCFEEMQGGIHGAQTSHSFNQPPPSPPPCEKRETSNFPQHCLLLCHLRLLWFPLTFGSPGRCQITIPKL